MKTPNTLAAGLALTGALTASQAEEGNTNALPKAPEQAVASQVNGVVAGAAEAAESVTYDPKYILEQDGTETTRPFPQEYYVSHVRIKNEPTGIGYVKLPDDWFLGNPGDPTITEVRLVRIPNGIFGQVNEADVLGTATNDGSGRFVFPGGNIPLDTTEGAETYGIQVKLSHNGRKRYPVADDATTSNPPGNIERGGMTSFNGTSLEFQSPAAIEFGCVETENIPAAPTLLSSSDSGASNSDRITNDTTPSFTGEWVAGDEVRLYIDGVLQSTTTIAVDAEPITSPGLPHGVHSFAYTVNDGPMSPATDVDVDTILPPAPTSFDLTAGSDTGNSNVDNITTVKRPIFTGDCPETSGTITLKIGGQVFASTPCTGGAFTLTPTQDLPLGNSNVVVEVEDMAGNVSPHSTINVSIIDEPSIPTTPMLVGGGGQVEEGGIAQLDVACDPGDTVNVYVDGQYFGSHVCDGGPIDIDLAGLPAGTYNISYDVESQEHTSPVSEDFALEIVEEGTTPPGAAAPSLDIAKTSLRSKRPRVNYPPVYVGNVGDAAGVVAFRGRKGNRKLEYKYLGPEGTNETGRVITTGLEKPLEAGEQFGMRVKAALTRKGKQQFKSGRGKIRQTNVLEASTGGKKASTRVRTQIKPPRR